MSVCFFSAEELGNVAAFMVRGERVGPELRRQRIEAAAQALAIVSAANARCFNSRYHDGRAVPHSAEEILAAIPKHSDLAAIMSERRAAAVSTASLLQYNCVEDKDYLATIEGGHDALIEVLKGVLLWVAAYAGVRS